MSANFCGECLLSYLYYLCKYRFRNSGENLLGTSICSDMLILHVPLLLMLIGSKSLIKNQDMNQTVLLESHYSANRHQNRPVSTLIKQ